MERHARYALVGVVSIGVLIAAIVFVVWLGRVQFNQQYDQYRILFEGPVNGMSEGGDVLFNGIKVGEIERVALDDQAPSKVVVDIEVDASTPVRSDSQASTELQGISGIRAIQISPGSEGQPLLKRISDRERPIIPSEPNALSSLLQGGGEVLTNVNEAVTRVNRVLADETIADLHAAIAAMRATSESLAANRAMFDDAASALAKLDAAAGDVQQVSASIREMVQGDGRQAIADISRAAREIELAASDARATLASLGDQSDALGAETLPTIGSTMRSIEETAESLDGLIDDIRRDPQGTLGKSGGRELEIPQ